MTGTFALVADFLVGRRVVEGSRVMAASRTGTEIRDDAVFASSRFSQTPGVRVAGGKAGANTRGSV